MNPLPPLSLYIHLPWCIQKCPYCDFNSHTLRTELKEKAYIQRLKQDLGSHLPKVQGRALQSIFIGGGTPSLFSGESLDALLKHIQQHIPFEDTIEITLEANPGTVEQARFNAYRQAGINRISLGIQSFQPDKLKTLGRIHDDGEARAAIQTATSCGFDNINIDIMHGLPGQTVDDALYDLQTALDHQPTHLSWYQLTIEPNTQYHQHPPVLPKEQVLAEIEQQGLSLLLDHGFCRYEVSAFSQKGCRSKHNMNYWTFGDYLAIGAGAHAKITTPSQRLRYRNIKHPDKYLSPNHAMLFEEIDIPQEELAFEFMLNALRLYQSIPYALFEARTGLAITTIAPQLQRARKDGLLLDDGHITTTALGKQYLNDLVRYFL